MNLPNNSCPNVYIHPALGIVDKKNNNIYFDGEDNNTRIFNVLLDCKKCEARQCDLDHRKAIEEKTNLISKKKTNLV